MDREYLFSKSTWPRWADKRYRKLDFYDRFLHGRAYQDIKRPFHQEMDGERYVPLRERRPSVIYNIAKTVVQRSTRLLFAGTHFPRIDTSDPELTNFLQSVVDTSQLQQTFLRAAYEGSNGSVLVLFGIVEGQVFYEVWNSKDCKPSFSKTGELTEVQIRYLVDGYSLQAAGFEIKEDELDADWFFIKRFTTTEEQVFNPIRVEEWDAKKKLTPLPDRSISHNLGFCPGVWIKNFPSNSIDGDCTFDEAIPLFIEIDYALSQLGRGLKYNMDPQLLIKEPAGGLSDEKSPGGENNPATMPVRSTNNVIFTSEKGDAKLLEMSGQGHKVVIDFIENLRKYALEVCSASRKDSDNTYGNTSGRAMEILNEDIIALASIFRLTYGGGLKDLLIKVIKAAKKIGLLPGPIAPKATKAKGKKKPAATPADDSLLAIKLLWGNWFDPTPADLQTSEIALTEAVKSYRLYEQEARQISANLWQVGHANAKELQDQVDLPPEPKLVKDLKDMKSKPGPGAAAKPAPGASGRSDAKVQG